MIRNYKNQIPFSHIDDAAKVQAKPPKMGCIGNANRLNPNRFAVNSPGVGAYDMANYVSFARAKQTGFTDGTGSKTP